jgi:uncharacterized protein involved in exopolysaccharide biosynthesis
MDSPTILGAVVDSALAKSTSTNLAADAKWPIAAPHSGIERDAAIRQLREMMATSASLKTGIVRFSVKSESPSLAVGIAQRVLSVLSQFNVKNRQTQAAAERAFVEQRLGEVASDLRLAELRLQEFLQRNRDYRGSPQLTFEFDRLSRDLSFRQQLYTSVAQAYEQAKIDAVRDTPLFSIIEVPQIPSAPNGRGIARGAILALLSGLFVGSFAAIGLAAYSNRRTHGSVDWSR